MKKLFLLLLFITHCSLFINHCYSQDAEYDYKPYSIGPNDSVVIFDCDNYMPPECELVKIYRVVFETQSVPSNVRIYLDNKSDSAGFYLGNSVDVEFKRRAVIKNLSGGTVTGKYKVLIKHTPESARDGAKCFVSGRIQIDVYRSSWSSNLSKKYKITFESSSGEGSILRVVADNIFVMDMIRGQTSEIEFFRMIKFVNEGDYSINAKYFLSKP